MKNKDDISIEERERQLFSELEVGYSRSKDEVWAAMQDKLETEAVRPQRPVRRIAMTWQRMSLAASVLLLLGLGLFAGLHTVTYEVGAGATATVDLPDGSKVYLNAVSEMRYAPYAWRFHRSVHLDGEAFFDVEKGRKFYVVSDGGTTEVLGTSFNIYARGSTYQVYCATGKVKVCRSDEEVILSPGEFADLDDGETLRAKKLETDEAVLSWRSNRFVYNTTPLVKVLQDVERQYAISIELNIEHPEDYHYTGLFERNVSAEEALQIICYAFELEFEKQAPDAYRIDPR